MWVFWSVERLAAGQLAYTDVVVSLVFFSGVRGRIFGGSDMYGEGSSAL